MQNNEKFNILLIKVYQRPLFVSSYVKYANARNGFFIFGLLLTFYQIFDYFNFGNSYFFWNMFLAKNQLNISSKKLFFLLLSIIMFFSHF